MKRIVSTILCIILVFSSINLIKADENGEDVYRIVSVEFSDNKGTLEQLQVLVKDENVYANAEEIGTRLGYQVSISDEYVSIYNKEESENVPYGLTVFYFNKTQVGHMLFTEMVNDYEAPFKSIKNEKGAWIPFQYALLLLNSSMVPIGNTLLIDMPEKNIVDIYTDLLKNNGKYLFDWSEDTGISEENLQIMGESACIITMFNGALKKDGEIWAQFGIGYAVDNYFYDAKYAEQLAKLFCTYSDKELKQEIDNIEDVLDYFSDKGTLGKTLKELSKSVPSDADIETLQKTCEELKNNIDGSQSSITAYNRAYQALEKACDEATLFSETGGTIMDIQKGVSKATGFLDKLCSVAEVIGYVQEFQSQDEFAVDALLEFVSHSNSGNTMSQAMKDGISNYANILQTDIVIYSALRYLEDNYDKKIFEWSSLSSALGTTLNLELIAWDLVSSKVPFYKEGIEKADSFELSLYAGIFQSDAFNEYISIRDSVFSDKSDITAENLYEVSQYCYAYMKFCYIAREAALGALNDKTKENLPNLIKREEEVNQEIAAYLVKLKNAKKTNERGCYGFLPEDSKNYIEKYDVTSFIDISEDGMQDLIGKWKIDSNKTNDENEDSLIDMYGSSLTHYEAYLEIGENGEFSYCIGIGKGGSGTCEMQGEKVLSYTITTYEESENITGTLTLEQKDDQLYLIMSDSTYNDSIYKVYWIKEETSTGSNLIQENNIQANGSESSMYGSILFKTEYQVEDYCQGCFIVSKNDGLLYGVLNMNGDEVVPVKYDTISFINKDNVRNSVNSTVFICARYEDLNYVFDINGNEILSTQYNVETFSYALEEMAEVEATFYINDYSSQKIKIYDGQGKTYTEIDFAPYEFASIYSVSSNGYILYLSSYNGYKLDKQALEVVDSNFEVVECFDNMEIVYCITSNDCEIYYVLGKRLITERLVYNLKISHNK